MRSRKSAAKGRNEQVIRILQIVGDLGRGFGATIGDLANRYGVNRKTIGRDFDVLRALAIPLEADKVGVEKRWRIGAAHSLSKLESLFDVSHYLALRLAMEPDSKIPEDSPEFFALEDLATKIEKAVGKTGKEDLAAIEEAFFVYDKRAYRDTPRHFLWPLVHAIHGRRICRVTYRAPREPAIDKTYEVLPLRLFTYDGALYLMCFAPRFRTHLKLNLQRLRDLKLLRKKGTVPRDFDPEALENAAFGLVAGDRFTTYRLRFDKYVAPFIRERTWHPSQRLKELPDRSVELEFRCTDSYEVDVWVQSWGEGVEVLAPASLRRKQRELGEWLVETYRKPVRKMRGRGRSSKAVR